MKPEEENFDQLQRLLRLKRHETPPPGYFNDFSSNVIAQIRAGGKSRHENLLEWLYFEAPWMERLLNAFETKPVLSWGVGAAICAVIISAVVLSQNADTSPANTATVADVSTVKPADPDFQPAFNQPQTAQAQAQIQDGTNSQPGSLFDQIQPQTQPAGWHP